LGSVNKVNQGYLQKKYEENLRKFLCRRKGCRIIAKTIVFTIVMVKPN